MDHMVLHSGRGKGERSDDACVFWVGGIRLDVCCLVDSQKQSFFLSLFLSRIISQGSLS